MFNPPGYSALACWLANLLAGVLVPVTLTLAPARAQQPPIDPQLAQKYFLDAQTASTVDHGALWGKELYGPMLFIDPETHAVVANQADREGKLQLRAGVYEGKLPPEVAPANTAIHWAGMDWTMVEWPLPQFRQGRVRLLMHECYHRIQSAIGLPGADASPSHLDTAQGRIWMQIEWRALEHAMWLAGPARRQAIADALYFRAFRQSLFPATAGQEKALEMNEGLAEYTGMKLSTASPEEFAMMEDGALREAPSRHPNFVRSFAYVSGPAYGWLLDAAGTSWRAGLKPQSDMGALLARAYHIELPAASEPEAVRRAQAYDGGEVIGLEAERERDRQERWARAHQRYIAGPVLILPADAEISYGFDPNQVVSVDESSTVYEGGQVSDTWGVLRAAGGFLIVRGAKGVLRVQVPAPADTRERPLKGEGWTLELTPGWVLRPGPRPGDWTLQRQGAP